jgi:hypothetical protein
MRFDFVDDDLNNLDQRVELVCWILRQFACPHVSLCPIHVFINGRSLGTWAIIANMQLDVWILKHTYDPC